VDDIECAAAGAFAYRRGARRRQFTLEEPGGHRSRLYFYRSSLAGDRAGLGAAVSGRLARRRRAGALLMAAS
jgi:hypothetical protein